MLNWLRSTLSRDRHGTRFTASAPVQVSSTEEFSGEVAVVAGAGAIGTAIVSDLIARGAHVVALDRDASRLAALAKAVANGRLETRCVDLVDAAAVDALAVEGCSLLVLAAGVQFEVDSLSDDDLQLQQAMQTNIAAPARLMRKIAPQMRSRRAGSIVLVSSIHSRLPSRWANYSASKAAQEAMMREWAVDLAPYGVRVNAVAPGWSAPEERASRLALLHQRTIPPQFIARAVSFLADDMQSRYTTGTVLTIDAGASLYSGRVPFDPPKRH